MTTGKKKKKGKKPKRKKQKRKKKGGGKDSHRSMVQVSSNDVAKGEGETRACPPAWSVGTSKERWRTSEESRRAERSAEKVLTTYPR